MGGQVGVGAVGAAGAVDVIELAVEAVPLHAVGAGEEAVAVGDGLDAHVGRGFAAGLGQRRRVVHLVADAVLRQLGGNGAFAVGFEEAPQAIGATVRRLKSGHLAQRLFQLAPAATGQQQRGQRKGREGVHTAHGRLLRGDGTKRRILRRLRDPRLTACMRPIAQRRC
jgi:hypothetical protein